MKVAAAAASHLRKCDYSKRHGRDTVSEPEFPIFSQLLPEMVSRLRLELELIKLLRFHRNMTATWERLFDGVGNGFFDYFGNDSVNWNFDFVPDVVVFRVRLRNSNSQILRNTERGWLRHIYRKFLEKRNMNWSMSFRVCRVDIVLTRAVQNRFNFRVVVR